MHSITSVFILAANHMIIQIMTKLTKSQNGKANTLTPVIQLLVQSASVYSKMQIMGIALNRFMPINWL